MEMAKNVLLAVIDGSWQFRIASEDPRKYKTNTGKSVPFCSTTSYFPV